MDGNFSSKTKEALETFQDDAGLKVDGLAGPKTKATVLQARLDNMTMLEDVKGDSPYNAGDTVKYWVGRQPGYLPRDDVLADIDAALNSWAPVAVGTSRALYSHSNLYVFLQIINLFSLCCSLFQSLTMCRVEDKAEANLKISVTNTPTTHTHTLPLGTAS